MKASFLALIISIITSSCSPVDGILKVPKPSGGNGKFNPNLWRYATAIKNHIESNWVDRGEFNGGTCHIRIRQARGGRITESKVTKCHGNEKLKKSIESAITKSSPLPYKGFELVFQQNINFVFRP